MSDESDWKVPQLENSPTPNDFLDMDVKGLREALAYWINLANWRGNQLLRYVPELSKSSIQPVNDPSGDLKLLIDGINKWAGRPTKDGAKELRDLAEVVGNKKAVASPTQFSERELELINEIRETRKSLQGKALFEIFFKEGKEIVPLLISLGEERLRQISQTLSSDSNSDSSQP